MGLRKLWGGLLGFFKKTSRSIVVLECCVSFPLFSCSVMSHSLWPQGLQHTRFSCHSPTFWGACSNSGPLSWWCHPTISSSVVPFSSFLKSFPASGSFLMSWLFKSCGQRIRASASASVLPMNIQDWFPLGFDCFDLLAVQGILKNLLQHHSSKESILLHSAFFMAQLSHPYISLVTQSCPFLCDPVDCSMTGFPVYHQLLELTQTYVHWVGEPTNHLILCHPLLLQPSIFPSIRVFSNELVLCIRWPKY